MLCLFIAVISTVSLELWFRNIKTGLGLSRDFTHWNKEKGTERSWVSGWLTSAHVRTAVTDACSPGTRWDMLGCHNSGLRMCCHDCKEEMVEGRGVVREREIRRKKRRWMTVKFKEMNHALFVRINDYS